MSKVGSSIDIEVVITIPVKLLSSRWIILREVQFPKLLGILPENFQKLSYKWSRANRLSLTSNWLWAFILSLDYVTAKNFAPTTTTMLNDCGELVTSIDSFMHLEVSYVNLYIRANRKSLLRRKANWVGVLS